MSERRGGAGATLGGLIGLAAGLLVGIAVHAAHRPALDALAGWFGVAGDMWTRALRMLVIPFVVTSIVVAIARQGGGRGLGRIGALTVGAFILVLATGVTFSLLVAPPLVRALPIDEAVLRALVPKALASAPAATPPELSRWLTELVPANAIRAAAEDAILPVVLFTILFGVALTRIDPERREALTSVFRAAQETLSVVLRWVLKLAPFGIFGLAAALAAEAGVGSVAAFGVWVVLVCSLLLAFTGLLYPFTALLGRISIARFAWAVAPAQMVAVGTRSSLASLPALLDSAERRLRLPPAISGLVLPLATSTIKVDRSVGSVTKLFFLAALYHVTLEPEAVAGFLLTITALSFSTPGLPGAGTIGSLPAYVACGIPAEGVLLLNAVEAIPDIFKTLVNVTTDMSVAVIVNRVAGARLPAAPDPELEIQPSA